MKVIFFVLFFIITAGILYIFQYFFWPFLFALILYIALRPVQEKLLAHMRNRTLSTIAVIVILFIIIIVPFFYLVMNLANQSYQLYNIIQEKVEKGDFNDIGIIKQAMEYFQIHSTNLIKKAAEFLEKTAVTAFMNLTKLISFQISFTMNFLFMIMILFFLLKDGHRLGGAFYRILPFPDDIEKKIVLRLKDVIKVLLAGNLIIMSLQGLGLGLGFFLAGIDMPLLWGSFAAVLSLIPVVGTTLIWLPGALYLFFKGYYISAIFVGIWSMLWYLLLENIVKPKIFGRRLNFHPMVFFFLILGSIQAFGIAGVIVGPLLLTLFFSLWEIYKFINEYELMEKDEGRR